MGLTFWTWTITLVACLFFIAMSMIFKRKADISFTHYAIAGGTLPFFLILFTDIATIMGVGNFIGHSAEGYKIGFANIPFVIGEQGAKVLFALVFAGFAARFTYHTLAELMHDLILRDRLSRILVAVLTASIMLAWVSGQAMGLGALFATFTGTDPLIMIIVFSLVFIIYTTIGGIYSVVWTDLIQGALLVGLAIWFYFQVFSEINFSLSALQSGLADVGAAGLMEFDLSVMEVLTLFVTGTFGVLAAQMYWQRCFAADSPKTASRAMFYSGLIAIIFTIMATVSGMVVKMKNPDLDPNEAISWLILEEMTMVAALAFFVLIFMAAISSASSLLHSASVVIVNDLIMPSVKGKSDAYYVKLTRYCVALVGIFSITAALLSDSIIGLFSLAYSMTGGGVIPVLIVGLLWKEKRADRFEMGEQNSRVSKWGARVGIVSGSVISLAFGILWGVLASVLLTVILSLLMPNKPGGHAAAEVN